MLRDNITEHNFKRKSLQLRVKMPITKLNIEIIFFSFFLKR